jgi:two-component system KDP operon response regulator KdpE
MSAAPIKVLVVDDEPPIRKLLRMGLTTQGYEILEAPNGKAALELLSQGPALIILDLGLPDIQGHELLRIVRGRNDTVPIVVLSSRDDEVGKVQALDLGADDYLTKPFGMDELLRCGISYRSLANVRCFVLAACPSIWCAASSG